MRRVFADTFFWIALGDPNDEAHNAAVSLAEEYGQATLVTTDEVLSEFLTFFAARSAARRHAAALVKELLASPLIHVIPQSRESFVDGLALYAARLDKGYSLTDCVSMQAMRREGITVALTGDKHFEQEGFRILF